ncbi:MAG: MaoC family dehydratase N-terminal domain-containing protein [Acidibacillus sp.]|uniref:FAS1-like dehydratase domain-containing protein n=1 Tax=Sulfoacidibacillus ferrooxidans TaxID=2005001 RepID=A0A9X1V7Q6_9BACL|nr:MaoC family dehydratase N-terminal domain-containing protein [Sulfoacidibacillus ferrooxidans]MCI0183096.1 hypothetical protein [Sulfoacidibacillus ferrooxidans]MCY0893194.1 MaoC family dehydratase N-terminal domain-containing protein [Acidibacillus sp.]
MTDDFIGRWSTAVPNVVERGAVRKFADAIGDANPVYRDDEAAKKSRFGQLIAPPTFSRTFEYGIVEGFQLEGDGLIHGEQVFHFERPIYVGEEVYCSMRVADTYTRDGGSGKMTFYLFEQKGETATGELIFTAKMNVIRRDGGAS